MNKIVFAGKISQGKQPVSRFYEIILPSGDGEIIFADEKFCFFENCAVCVPPLCAYEITGQAGALLVTLDKALLPFKRPVILRDESAQIRYAAERAEEYFAENPDGNALICDALGELIAAYVITFSPREKYSPVTETLRLEIEKKVSDPTFSAVDAIKKLPLNGDYVRKLFKKEVGLTPHDFLLSKRMQLAAKLLSSGISNQYSNYSVSQIAEACGFAEPLYFSRVFKKHFGVSPSKYCE